MHNPCMIPIVNTFCSSLTEIGNYGSFFSLFIPPKNLKNQNFEKMKMCTKNHNHMRYDSWDMEWDRHNFFSFWANFCPFNTLLTLKIKIWEKCEKKQDMCTINEDHMMYSSWDIRHNKQSFLSFWVIFPLWPP